MACPNAVLLRNAHATKPCVATRWTSDRWGRAGGRQITEPQDAETKGLGSEPDDQVAVRGQAIPGSFSKRTTNLTNARRPPPLSAHRGTLPFPLCPQSAPVDNESGIYCPSCSQSGCASQIRAPYTCITARATEKLLQPEILLRRLRPPAGRGASRCGNEWFARRAAPGSRREGTSRLRTQGSHIYQRGIARRSGTAPTTPRKVKATA